VPDQQFSGTNLAQIFNRLISCPALENKNSAAVAGGALRLSLDSNGTSVYASQSELITRRSPTYPELIRGIPDMRYINREVRIREVAHALDFKFDGPSKIHCWHPDRHKRGDRTASVGIRTSNNTVKCFGCVSKPMGPIDLVMDVLDTAAADAALWIAARFTVPSVPRRRPVPKLDAPYRVGYEHGIGLLIRSGLWGTLSEAARCIAPVLLGMAEKVSPASQDFTLQMSYVAISRFSGVRSHRAIRKALVELADIGFSPPALRRPTAPSGA
jgi:hypothetical protein